MALGKESRARRFLKFEHAWYKKYLLHTKIFGMF